LGEYWSRPNIHIHWNDPEWEWTANCANYYHWGMQWRWGNYHNNPFGNINHNHTPNIHYNKGRCNYHHKSRWALLNYKPILGIEEID
jgi:hypothetical protein